jgi:hypothetical protein
MARFSCFFTLCILGAITEPTLSQEPSAMSPRNYWKAAREQFKRAGELIGDGEIAAAESALNASAQNLKSPYNRMARSFIRQIDSIHQNRHGSNGYHAYGRAGRLCFELGAYDAASKWKRRARQVSSQGQRGIRGALNGTGLILGY